MDETACFFKALPEKGLAKKKSQAREGKVKNDAGHCIFRECCWGKTIEPLVVWRSKKPLL